MTIPLPQLTPANLAAIFWEMDSMDQGAFFDELGSLVLSTPETYTGKIGTMFGLDMQMYYAARNCTPLGRDVMSRISENGHNYLKPQHHPAQGF